MPTTHSLPIPLFPSPTHDNPTDERMMAFSTDGIARELRGEDAKREDATEDAIERESRTGHLAM
jgi:hypothetical protein